jgi:hypothetical protein
MSQTVQNNTECCLRHRRINLAHLSSLLRKNQLTWLFPFTIVVFAFLVLSLLTNNAGCNKLYIVRYLSKNSNSHR